MKQLLSYFSCLIVASMNLWKSTLYRHMPILLPFVAPAGSVSRPESKPRCRFTRNLALESCHMQGVTRVTRVTSRRVEESNVMRSNCDSSCVIKHRVKHQDNSKSTPFFFVEINAFVNFDKVCFVCFFVSGRAGGSRALAKRRWCCRWTSPPLWRSKLPEAKQNEAWRNSVAKIRRLAGLTLWSLDKAC